MDDPWVGLVGQHEARDRLVAASENLVHAYLFLGASGSGKLAAAQAFAGLILANEIADDPEAANRSIRLAVAGEHPDVIVIEAQGSALRVVEADEIAKASMRTPVEGSRKVIIIPNVDVIEATAIGKLLKVIEEPPPSTLFILLGQEISPEFVTIASRCVTIEFSPLTSAEIASVLRSEHPDADEARLDLASSASAGDLKRARLLLTDEGLVERANLWASVPLRLDGRGVTLVELANEILAAIEGSLESLKARQKSELEDLDEWVEQFGERGSGRAALVDRHKREARRLRTDEIRFGLAVLARHYRDSAVSGSVVPVAALRAIQDLAENLVRNPNEALQLQGLFMKLQAAQLAHSA